MACTLHELVLPKSVVEIKDGAFSNYVSISKVYYGGTESDWDALLPSIGRSNSHLLDAPRFYYSEKRPETFGNYWRFVNGVPTAW